MIIFPAEISVLLITNPILKNPPQNIYVQGESAYITNQTRNYLAL